MATGPYFYQQYQKQKEVEIRQASKVKLVTMLLEGAICFNRKAIDAISQGVRVTALENSQRASKIVMHLYSCLDFEKGGEIANQLGSLYSYACDCYIKFNKAQNESYLHSINEVLQSVLVAWRQIEEGEKQNVERTEEPVLAAYVR